MKILSRLLLASACFVATGAIGASAAPPAAQLRPYLHSQRMIDVGGHSLNLYCTGHGSPSVILDAGEGETTFTWRKVQPSIATFARVCSFDRAGMGFSGPGPLPRDANAMVADMHALLQRAGVPPPYVLVDRSFPNQTAALHAASPTMAHMESMSAGAYRFCHQSALRGTLGIRKGSKANAICGFPPTVAADVKADCAKNGALFCKLELLDFARYLKPAFWSALGSEDAASYGIDSTEDIRAQRAYGALPLIVLTAANDTGQSPIPKSEMRAVDRVWTAGHDRLARLSTVGVNYTVEHAEHSIQVDRPSKAPLA